MANRELEPTARDFFRGFKHSSEELRSYARVIVADVDPSKIHDHTAFIHVEETDDALVKRELNKHQRHRIQLAFSPFILSGTNDATYSEQLNRQRQIRDEHAQKHGLDGLNPHIVSVTQAIILEQHFIGLKGNEGDELYLPGQYVRTSTVASTWLGRAESTFAIGRDEHGAKLKLIKVGVDEKRKDVHSMLAFTPRRRFPLSNPFQREGKK